MPIVTLTNVNLAFGTDQILSHADLTIDRGERLAFAGRNGAGKSTLLGMIQGSVTEDDGSIWRADSLRFAMLRQDLPDRVDETVFDTVAKVFDDLGAHIAEYHELSLKVAEDSSVVDRMGELQSKLDHSDGWNISHRIEATLQRLGLEPDEKLTHLSGGWLKRVAIAQSLVLEPDVWILDEPTNHLDLEGIQWLESLLLDFQGTILFVSHDRRLMQSIATSVIEIDRGRVTRYNCDYLTFIERRDTAREVETEHNKQFDDKLKQEEVWIRQGIKARRTRNEGRVRALEALRDERSQRIGFKELKLQADSGEASGKIVKETIGLSKQLGGAPIVSDLDLIIQRGDRIGLLGPNGCGKSTLVRLLLEQMKPDSGTVKTGSRLQIAYFDQSREQLNQQETVQEYIAEGRDFIDVGGKEVHVISYLQNFMFNPDQSRAPIRTLSGGEQNRLLLAKLFAMPTNFLVLDEPTNDLDIETLELLEELLLDYDGTVLLVSHDRTFMDNVVSSLLVFEGAGLITEYMGGYTQWLASRSGSVNASKKTAAKVEVGSHQERKQKKAAVQKKARDLEKITASIESTELKIKAQSAAMADSGFFNMSAEKQTQHYDKAASLERELEQLMADWETLESDEG